MTLPQLFYYGQKIEKLFLLVAVRPELQIKRISSKPTTLIMPCSICGKSGHNARTCGDPKVPRKPTQKKKLNKKKEKVKNPMTMLKQVNSILKIYPNALHTKIKNITGKSSVRNDCPASTHRVPTYSLISIPIDVVEKNDLSVSQLSTHEGAVCVYIPPSRYLKISKKENRTELEQHLFDNVGTDHQVSCIVAILTTRISSSKEARVERQLLDDLIKRFAWRPVVRRTKKRGSQNLENDSWEGHYYYKISGGQQDSLYSWGDDEKEPQIFTTHRNFTSTKKIALDVKFSLAYQFMLSKGAREYYIENKKADSTAEFDTVKGELEQYLKTQTYMDVSCYDSIHNIGKDAKLPVVKEGVLYDPITAQPMRCEQFWSADKSEIPDVSHDESVSMEKIYWDEKNQTMLSDYRPGNLFWSGHENNIRQGERTLKEYLNSHNQENIDLLQHGGDIPNDILAALQLINKYVQS